MRLLRSLIVSLPLAMTLAAVAAPGTTVTTDQVRAELVAHAPQGIVAGQPLWLGLAIEHKPHWHTYWKNPGDSGLPTTLQWTLPAGFQAGEIDWPTPQRLPIGPLMNHGYEGKLLLPVRVDVPLQHEMRVPIRTDVQIDQAITIPINTGFGMANIPIPIRATIPVSATVPIQIDETLPISTTVPIRMEVPLEIDLGSASLAGYFDDLYRALIDLRDKL